jgi:carbon-monoxide dehydrogenase medium subunit
VDVNPIPDLRYLRREGDALCIGALTTHRMIEISGGPVLAGGFEVLRRAARHIGHYPIRTRGTFGGSIAHADPTAEWCLVAVLLDAEIRVAGPRGKRTIPARDFFVDMFTTALAYDEMITEVRFPTPAPRAAFQEFALRHGDFAIVSAAVALDLDGSICRSARIALGGVDVRPIRVAEAEAALRGAPVTAAACAEAARIVRDAIRPWSDQRAGEAYRRDLAETLTRRALAEAIDGG